MVKVLCYRSEGRWFVPSWCNWNFFIDLKFFRSHCGPGCVRLTTLPPSCAVVMKSGNLNFLESFGLLQTCNGTDLSFLVDYLKPCFRNVNDSPDISLALNGRVILVQFKESAGFKFYPRRPLCCGPKHILFSGLENLFL